MLIELSISNYKSIAETQTFSMVASKLSDLNDNIFALTEPNDAIELLKTAAIYGANASGKSNFIDAVKVVRDIVQYSALGFKQNVLSSRQNAEELPVEPFRLDDSFTDLPSEFELIFIANSIRYQFGFCCTKQMITSEWLFSFPYGRTRTLYQREWDPELSHYKTYFGQELKGDKSVWERSTRKNALFLSTAVLLNSEQLKPIYQWFKQKLKFSSSRGWSVGFTAESCMSDNKERILSALRNVDTGIEELEVKEEKFDLSELPLEIPNYVRKFLTEEKQEVETLEINTFRKNNQGRLVKFGLEEESEGTRKLFGFLGPWIDCLSNGNILFIDEINNSLHPKMVEFLISLFNNSLSNPNNAQLIFSTHETSILKQDVFRRDQIWFCEKNHENKTKLYPLTNFSVRKGTENLEDSYLAGKFGALPFIGINNV